MQKFLEYVVLGALFLLTLLPLVVIPETFFPFIFGKALLFRVFVEVAVVAFVLLVLSSHKYTLRITSLTIVFGSFVLVMFVANLLGVDPVRSFLSNFERMDGWITLLHLFLLFVVAEHVLMKHWKTFLQVSLGVSVLVGLYGLLQIGGVFVINQGGVRVDSTLGNATYLSVYALIHFFIALWLVSSTRQRVLWAVYGLIGLLNVLMVYLTATRGAFVGLVVGVFVGWLWYAYVHKHQRALMGLFFAVLVAIGSFSLLSAYKDAPAIAESPTLSRIANIDIEAGEVRFTLWGMALEGIKERPLLGWGQENFTPIFAKYYEPSLFTQEPWFDRAHNVVVDWFVSGGIIGGVLYLLLFVVAVYQVVRMRSVESAVVLALIVAYFVQNLFVFDNTISYLFFALLLAWVSSKMTTVATIQARDIFPDTALRGAGIAVGVAVLIVVWVQIHAPALAANRALITAVNPRVSAEIRFDAYQVAANATVFADQEVSQHSMQFALQALQAPNAPDEIKEVVVRQSLAILEEQAMRAPHSPRAQLFFGLLLRSVGLTDEAEIQLEKARVLAPRKQMVLFELGALYIHTGEFEKAVEIFKEAHELAPEFKDPFVLYAMSLMYAGRVGEAEELLIERFGYVPVLEENLASIYVALGLQERYYQLWDEFVALEGESMEAFQIRQEVERAQ